MIGTTGDPATPVRRRARRWRHASQGSDLLTFDSTEHTAFGRGISTCIDDAVDALPRRRHAARAGHPLRT